MGSSSKALAVKRVLCIEDDADTRELFAETLSHDGFAVTTAANAGEAHDALEAKTFDLIVTDFELPDGDGSTLVEAARAEGTIHEARVVMITGSERARRVPNVDMWTKPVDPATLGNRLRALLDKRGERGR